MKATNQDIQAVYDGSIMAYSYPAYKNWRAVCAMLLRAGFTVEESITILLSKWTRWAGDASFARYGDYTSKDLRRFLEGMGPNLLLNLDIQLGIKNNKIMLP